MKKLALLSAGFIALALSANAAVVFDGELVIDGGYASAPETVLTSAAAIDNADLINGVTPTVGGLGFHSAAYPQSNVTMTDGLLNITETGNGLYGLLGDDTDASNTADMANTTLQYDITAADIESIEVFAAHDGNGNRACLYFDVAVSSDGTNFTTVVEGAKNGTQGDVTGTNNGWGYVKVYDDGGADIGSAVTNILLTFYPANRDSTFFNPRNGYDGVEGAIIKEIDVNVGTSVNDWMMF